MYHCWGGKCVLFGLSRILTQKTANVWRRLLPFVAARMQSKLGLDSILLILTVETCLRRRNVTRSSPAFFARRISLDDRIEETTASLGDSIGQSPASPLSDDGLGI